jgi:hypothetical protein
MARCRIVQACEKPVDRMQTATRMQVESRMSGSRLHFLAIQADSRARTTVVPTAITRRPGQTAGLLSLRLKLNRSRTTVCGHDSLTWSGII